jgi:hypothetical protein
MCSSTSPFNVSRPKLVLVLILTALVGIGVSAWYTLRFNPEIRYFKKTHAIKQAWARQMTRDYGAKVVIYGGSSCEFSIDGERLLERFRLPCVNLGRGAGMGSVVLTMVALEETRPGDTLIVAMEPGLITVPLEMPHLGIQFSIATGHWNWIRHPLPPAEPVSWLDAVLALRPGGYHFFTMLGKLVSRQPLYRYRPGDTRPSGWHQTLVRLPITGPPGHTVHIPESTTAFLRSLRDRCAQQQIRLAYSLPWGYTPPDRVQSFQKENVQFLLQMAEIMPVLRDPRLGVYSVREHFSDTVWHLCEEGAALRTDELGQQITGWQVWSTEALQSELQKLQ